MMPATTPALAGAVGLSRSGLYRATHSGKFERIARGIYLPADAPTADWDLIEASTRRPDATICLISALAVHDLTDEIPDRLDIAIPRGSRNPATTRPITWHQFDAATFSIERSSMTIAGTDQEIGIYSPERCIADAFRLRGQVSYEIGRDALKEWLQRGGKPANLIDIALQLPRAKGPILHALEILT